ncbi:hypothetical protein NMY22_g10020 [Coprinellus aureogranulatus]|nr:hypothetical protein NMY22_g10020 [Coprinellus aureogranulatus]
MGRLLAPLPSFPPFPLPAVHTMAQGNLLGWANEVRLTMAKDTGRGFFQQQVHTQGFLFLDDYLDNILAGPKKDPLIELVKTPGRRKIVAKKPKTTSKLGTPIVFALGSSMDENAPPSAVPSNPPPSIPSGSKNSTHTVQPAAPKDLEQRPILGETVSQGNVSGSPALTVEETERPNQANETSAEQANLSVIAEDEEPSERVSVSIKTSHLLPPPKPLSNKRSSPDSSPELIRQPQSEPLSKPSRNFSEKDTTQDEAFSASWALLRRIVEGRWLRRRQRRRRHETLPSSNRSWSHMAL